LTAVTPASLTTEGAATAAAQYKSHDGKLILDIAAATKLTNSTGDTLTTLSAAVLADPPPAPEGNAILLAYELGPEGATFDPELTLTFSYGTLPEGAKNLRLMYWNGTAWKYVPADVDTAQGTVAASITHFSKYALIYQLPAPANIIFTGITISPENVKPDEKVTIQVAVINIGDLSGTYKLTLKVNDRQVEEKEVTVARGKTETVSFEVKRGMEGEYLVDVNGQKGKFTVGTVAPTPSGTIAEVASPTPTPAATSPVITSKPVTSSPAVAAPANPSPTVAATSPAAQNEEKPAAPFWWIIIGIAAAAALLIVIMVLMTRRKKLNT
jgi:hypothetical protein